MATVVIHRLERFRDIELPSWQRMGIIMLVGTNDISNARRGKICLSTFPDTVASVTFLAILAHDAIALPLSSSYPPSELEYILDNSEASLLLASSALQKKAEQVLKTPLRHKPLLVPIEEMKESVSDGVVTLEDLPAGRGGLMLYTSGTTNRPVGDRLPLQSFEGVASGTDEIVEGCLTGNKSHLRASEVADRSLEICIS